MLEHGLVSRFDASSPEIPGDLLAALQNKTLKTIAEKLKAKPSGPRAKLTERLIERMWKQKNLFGKYPAQNNKVIKLVHGITGDFIRLTPTSTLCVQKAQALFFLSASQSL